MRYLPYDGGGKAMLALLGGEVDVLSTGLGETVVFLTGPDGGQARALAVTAAERVAASATTPTLIELGFDVAFANWRGLFAPPDLADDALERHLNTLRAMRGSPQWQAVMAKRGWQPLDVDGTAFTAFLDEQEQVLAAILQRLGFAQ